MDDEIVVFLETKFRIDRQINGTDGMQVESEVENEIGFYNRMELDWNQLQQQLLSSLMCNPLVICFLLIHCRFNVCTMTCEYFNILNTCTFNYDNLMQEFFRNESNCIAIAI